MANNHKHEPYSDSIDVSMGFLPDDERMLTVHDRNIQPKLNEPIKDVPSTKGYHISDIPKGVFGDPSKIKEESEEFMDAVVQGSELMALVELSDLYGAMRGYLKKHHPTIKMSDLEKMSKITRRAFKNGHRS